MVQVQWFGTGARYGLEILRQCGKMVKTKSQKVLSPNSYVCRGWRGKSGRGHFCPPSWIGLIWFFTFNKMSLILTESSCQNNKLFFMNFFKNLILGELGYPYIETGYPYIKRSKKFEDIWKTCLLYLPRLIWHRYLRK